ncbi:TFIIB-type zinc ribbon-containing protein [Myxococcus landrumensis]|uniref:Zf-TFIIB domain-containing protein n=1 Tax=Myxococcus landrumensis TaxID=2813577 RepID=A0ABX7N0C7_9BACT|nr:zf-TFIIB domain-containing protein [Myxococcus landrumus]QSQ11155.1 zf-TFIIB domain-containing protein [Myxococcus landrumus]
MNRHCPICPQPAPTLRVIDIRGVSVDTCPRCIGHWLDAGELERLAPGWKTEAIEAAVPSASRRCRHSRHHVPVTREDCGLCGSPASRCPDCETFLSQVRTEVCAVDLCGYCRGIWLDANELKALVAWHRDTRRPLAVGAAVAGSAAAAAAAAIALAQVSGDSVGESKAAKAVVTTLEHAGHVVDAAELGVEVVDAAGMTLETVGNAVEVAVEGASAISEAVGGVLEAVAGLFP